MKCIYEQVTGKVNIRPFFLWLHDANSLNGAKRCGLTRCRVCKNSGLYPNGETTLVNSQVRNSRKRAEIRILPSWLIEIIVGRNHASRETSNSLDLMARE